MLAAVLASTLGAAVSANDPDRAVIEPGADTVAGRILDAGSGTGQWSGHLAPLGHDVGARTVERFVTLARDATLPAMSFGSLSGNAITELNRGAKQAG